MATGSDVINRAYALNKIRASETAITPAQLASGLEQLNDMLSLWEESGIRLGFTPLAAATDTLNVPRYSLGAIKSSLAVFLAAEFGISISESLATMAVVMKGELLNALPKNLEVNFPSTLPTGSGNECEADFFDDRFFPADEKINY